MDKTFIPFKNKDGKRYSIMQKNKRIQFTDFTEFFEWSINQSRLDGYIISMNNMCKVIDFVHVFTI